MASLISSAGLRSRLLYSAGVKRLGFGENAFLLPVAVLIGIVTAAAAVAFHELILWTRNTLYVRWAPVLYTGKGVWILILIPAVGGLIVGLFSTYVMRSREGHGVVDVMETVLRARGMIQPLSAVEKILTAAMTIGSGGSAGAEGPIVQIGAGIASMFGQFFQVTRAHLPILIGCGTAAGISAIFNSPIGGVLFTLEVILLDFSLRTFTPVVLASVIANVTTGAIYQRVLLQKHESIFTLDAMKEAPLLNWPGVPNLVLLGLVCGLAGVALTRLMYFSEERFHKLKLPRAIRPAIGGAMLGAVGVVYVVVFGWLLLGRPKPFDFHNYPMPAFFGDGYGVIQELMGSAVYADLPLVKMALLLAFLALAKLIGTCLTLSSGGSGGVIAPSLFLGATAGAMLGLALHGVGHPGGMDIGFYALLGMGAVLAAVVHAPLASILILFEVTGQRNVILPAMLACVVATGTAQVLFKDSVYTLALRRRGIRVGTGADLSLLRRVTVEQLTLEPAARVTVADPVESLIGRAAEGTGDFVVFDAQGGYAGMITADDLRTAVLQPDTVALLTAGDLLRADLPCVSTSTDLASVLEVFSMHEVARLPVSLAKDPEKVIGLVSRRELMSRYHRELSGAG